MKEFYDILVTEGRSPHPEWYARSTVRVFVEGDYNYGYWVPEDKLYEKLDEAQKKQYREDQSYTGGKYKVTKETAQYFIDIGQTPFNKITLI